jgi:NADPH:quinone reductase-like Zn-dependent oxidoreductase
VGVFAVQIAKALGAEVTGVCSSKNLDLVKSLNADLVIDYTEQDFTECNVQYDMIFDVVAKRSFSDCRKVLKPNGVYVATLPTPEVIFQSFLTAFFPGQKVKFVLEKPNSQDLLYLKDLIEAGKMRTVIDCTYPLQEIGSAHRYSEGERAVGKIAIVTRS